MLNEASKGMLHRCVSPERTDSRNSKTKTHSGSSGLVNHILMSIVMGEEDSSQLFVQRSVSARPKSSPLDLLDELLINDDCSDPFGAIEELENPAGVESISEVSFESIINEDLEPTPLATGLYEMPTNNSSLSCRPITPNLVATNAAEGALERLLAQEFQLGESMEPITETSSGAKKRAPQAKKSSPVPKKKRCTSNLQRSASEEGPKFRDYQEQQWNEKFQELVKFKSIHGHCAVPHQFDGDPALSRWVKRQRYQYKLLQKLSNESTMTKSRVEMLENIGFVWDSHAVAWEERLRELKEFQAEFGHCDVPSYYLKNPALAVWVKRQRRQVKLFWKGERSTITENRFEALRDLGFTWELRRSKNSL